MTGENVPDTDGKPGDETKQPVGKDGQTVPGGSRQVRQIACQNSQFPDNQRADQKQSQAQKAERGGNTQPGGQGPGKRKCLTEEFYHGLRRQCQSGTQQKRQGQRQGKGQDKPDCQKE